jgi:tetratricopeptide (TPR) repeat protein
MKQKLHINRPGTLALLLLTGLLLSSSPAVTTAQTVESAREKYESGDFEGALQELQSILALDSENLEAQSLLGETELAMRRHEARALTDRALVEINNRRFDEAYEYLEQALLLDPENEEARELYLSIHEVMLVEGESLEDMLERQQEELSSVGEEIPMEEAEQPETAEAVPEEDAAAAVTAEDAEKKPGEKGAEQEPVAVETPSGYDRAFIRGGLVLTFANSNNLEYVDSSVTMLGIHLEGRYYFDFWERRLGLSLDYIGDFLKLGGSEYVNFGTHRLNFSVRLRTYFFERDYGRLTVGARLNYHLFILNNRESLGVYNFTRVYGPSLGFFIEDPVLYRFWKKPFLRSFGLESEFNYLFLLGGGSEAPSSSELYLGAYYDLKRYRFHGGYRYYGVRNDTVKETYNDIELGAGYRF